MDDPATDDPMDADQDGHIHACCDEHELYWQDAHFATSLEGAPNEEILDHDAGAYRRAASDR